jgi:hypothetical protein
MKMKVSFVREWDCKLTWCVKQDGYESDNHHFYHHYFGSAHCRRYFQQVQVDGEASHQGMGITEFYGASGYIFNTLVFGMGRTPVHSFICKEVLEDSVWKTAYTMKVVR